MNTAALLFREKETGCYFDIYYFSGNYGDVDFSNSLGNKSLVFYSELPEVLDAFSKKRIEMSDIETIHIPSVAIDEHVH